MRIISRALSVIVTKNIIIKTMDNSVFVSLNHGRDSCPLILFMKNLRIESTKLIKPNKTPKSMALKTKIIIMKTIPANIFSGMLTSGFAFLKKMRGR